MTGQFKYITHIADLIIAELTGKISEAEQVELDRWKNESPEHLQIYKQYQSEKFVRHKVEFTRKHDLNEAYRGFVEKTSEVTRHRRRVMLYRYAGIVALLFISSGILYLNRETKEMPGPLVEKIMSGSCKAILTQPDGQEVDISNTSYLTYIEKNSPVVDSGKKIQQPASDTLRYYTVTIPRGGEYSLALSDGSSLKMNSESQIRIPETFDKNQRDVYMSGEIFFDVFRDTTAPFVVHTRQGEIKVLGTSFNVRDYQEELFMEATLVTGKIAFKRDGKDIYLQPSEQLRMNKTSDEITVESVDVRLYCSWKDGRFVFEKERLENIMNTISRWYDIHVFYENQMVKDILFTGNIKRYGDLEQVIDLLKLLNKINIKVEGNNVFVSSN